MVDCLDVAEKHVVPFHLTMLTLFTTECQHQFTTIFTTYKIQIYVLGTSRYILNSTATLTSANQSIR